MELVIVEDEIHINNIMLEFKEDIFNKKINEMKLAELSKKYAENAVFIVSFVDGVAVGYIAFYCNDQMNDIAFVSLIVVGDKFQRKGYGKMLLTRACEISQRKGMKAIQLQVNKNNKKAISFYRKMGFIEKGEEWDTINMHMPLTENLHILIDTER